jgi:hypothetical protein
VRKTQGDKERSLFDLSHLSDNEALVRASAPLAKTAKDMLMLVERGDMGELRRQAQPNWQASHE